MLDRLSLSNQEMAILTRKTGCISITPWITIMQDLDVPRKKCAKGYELDSKKESV